MAKNPMVCLLAPTRVDTHIIFYEERFIRKDFSTSQISQEFKEQTSLFIEK